MRTGEFYEDNEGVEYYVSTSRTVYRLEGRGSGWFALKALPGDAEILFMTNGGIYPIVAKRIERAEGETNE